MKTYKITWKDGRISYRMAESITELKKFYLKLGEGTDYYLNLIFEAKEC